MLGTGEAASAPTRRGVKDYARALVSTTGGRWTADLAVLGVLLTLTAVFGRAFSRLHIPGTPLYVTEIALAIVTVLALRRSGLSGSVARIRATVPVIPLVVFWLAGLIAAIRGLREFGFSGVLQDVGLVEYSVFLPLLALVVDSRARARLLADVLVYAGLAATVVFGFVFFFAPTSPVGPEQYPTSAATIYLALLVLLVGARWGHRVRAPASHLAAAGVATVLILLTVVRSALLALPAAFLALVVQLPRERRLVGGLVAGGALVVGGAAALAVQNTGFGWRPAAQLVATAAASPHYVADDPNTAFVGGRSVTGDAASGNVSRELALQETFEVAALSGLVPGETYTVIFSIRPLQPAPTKGFVGDTSGSGWGSKGWTVTRRLRWQSVQRSLTATANAERLVVWPTAGAARVRVDGVAVLKGGLLARAAEPPRPASPGSLATGRETRPPAGGEAVRVAPDDGGGGIPIIADIRHAFSGSVASGSSANVRWRLAYWRYVIGRSLERPVFGFGFGQPASFRWRGVLYDARRGDPSDYHDVSPPHNSFVNVLFRMGFIGLLALLALVGVAIWRYVAALRSRGSLVDRANLVGLGAIFVFILVIANFNVALEGPFMGIFFWTVLGLLTVFPKLTDRGDQP